MKYIKNFSDKLFENLILEKELIISDKLKDILKKMRHPFASLILSKLGEDLVDSSYIDIDKEPGMINYIPYNKEIDFHTKKELTEPDKWIKSRTKQPIARVIKPILSKLNIIFNESDIEKFVNEYKSLQKPSKFILAEGKDIIKYYSERNYSHDNEESSSLTHSCMRYDDAGKYLSVYVNNPNVKLVVMLDEYNKVSGRAVLWLNATANDKPCIFMDRIYTAKQAYEESFKNYAISNNWWFKVYQRASDDDITNGKDSIINAKIRVVITNDDWNHIKKPYMDTLPYLKEEFVNNKFAYTLSNFAGNTDWKEMWTNQDGACTKSTNYESSEMEMNLISSELELDISKLVPQKSKGVYQYGNAKYWITPLENAKKRCVTKLMKDDNWKRFATVKTLSKRYDYLIRNQVSEKVKDDIKESPEKYIKLLYDTLTPFYWVSSLTSNIVDGDKKEFLSIILEGLLVNKTIYNKFINLMHSELYTFYNFGEIIDNLKEFSKENVTKIVDLYNGHDTKRLRQFIIDKFENKNKPDNKFNKFVVETLPREQLIAELDDTLFIEYNYIQIAKINSEFFDEEKFMQDVYKDVKNSKYSLKWTCELLARFEEIRANVISTDGVEIIISGKCIYRIK